MEGGHAVDRLYACMPIIDLKWGREVELPRYKLYPSPLAICVFENFKRMMMIWFVVLLITCTYALWSCDFIDNQIDGKLKNITLHF